MIHRDCVNYINSDDSIDCEKFGHCCLRECEETDCDKCQIPNGCVHYEKREE